MADAKAPPPAAPEPSDVDVRAIVLLGFALVAIVAFCTVALLGLRAWLERDYAQHAGPSTPISVLQRFASPRLEPAPRKDITELHREKAAKLHRYRWIDRKAGVMQIPIERAMQLLTERGGR
jgi:hypothetical protein